MNQQMGERQKDESFFQSKKSQKTNFPQSQTSLYNQNKKQKSKIKGEE